MASINIKLEGLDKLTKKLSSVEKNINTSLYKSIDKNTKTVQGNAKALCSVKDGELRQSIVEETEQNGNKVTGTVSTNKEYAPYVEFGTGPVGEANKTKEADELGVTYSQNKWKGKIPDVGWRYIAGQKPQPFMYPALHDNIDDIVNNVKKDLKNAIKGESE